jgi:hypothetical protein
MRHQKKSYLFSCLQQGASKVAKCRLPATRQCVPSHWKSTVVLHVSTAKKYDSPLVLFCFTHAVTPLSILSHLLLYTDARAEVGTVSAIMEPMWRQHQDAVHDDTSVKYDVDEG